MAQIQKRGNSWRIILELGRDPKTGERKRYYESVKGKKKDAEKRLVDLQHQYGQNNYTFARPKEILLSEQLNRFLHYKKSDLRKKTWSRYKEIVENNLIPFLGSYYIEQVTPQLIYEYYHFALTDGRLKDEGGLSPTTVRQHHTILNQAFQMAVDTKKLNQNPIASVKAPPKAKVEMNTLKVHELKRLLEYLRNKNSAIYIPVFIAAKTGARLSETLGLRWKDIDFQGKTISFMRGLHYGEKEFYFEPTKSTNSERTVTIDEEDAAVLKKHKKLQAQKKLSATDYQDGDLVCANDDGSPKNPFTVSSRFIRVARVLGFEVSFHSLRHSHASILLSNGAQMKFVSARLGHGSVAFTEDVYGRRDLDDDRNITKLFNSLLNTVETGF